MREYNRITRTGDTERLLNDNVRRALRFGIAEEIAKLKSSLALLGTAANTAPFIGLFGTVWGIMNSFTAIAKMKSVSLATVAPRITEALIATEVGLFVAIPAVCGYNDEIKRALRGEPCIYADYLALAVAYVPGQADRHWGRMHQLRRAIAQPPAARSRRTRRRHQLHMTTISWPTSM
ncbi:MotA/TolQ/ExbB proton channel family protein [Desulfovibrio falkowii]|uniref:MotA/TolQ/ExbB proton channel domain-containing protein n=1 Tax=Desulfovibrio falkowii TaxID=3136602 RepID=A0ABQ0E862_9BACT